MNVLMVAPKFPPFVGGVETHTFEVSRRLVRSGASVTVLTTDPTGNLPAQETVDAVQVCRVPVWFADTDWFVSPAVFGFVTARTWDVIHIQGVHSGVPPLTMLGAIRAGAPFVITFHHGGHSSRLRNAIRAIQWAALMPVMRRASHCIGVSQYEIDFFKMRLRLPATRFSLIPNGGALPCPVHPAAKPDGLKWIVSAGRLEKYKGHQRVIAAMPELLKREPHVRLRIAGAGPYETQLRQQAAHLGVAGHVVIQSVDVADRNGMAALLMQADLVTLLSDCESHPIGVMEAVALKRSALVADNSGMRELAQKGYARAVSLALSPEQLAGVMHEQLLHPLVPPAIPIPTWDDCAQDVLHVYRRVLAQRGALCAS